MPFSVAEHGCVLLVNLSGEPTDEEIGGLLARVKSAFLREKEWALLVDIRALGHVTARQRQMLADYRVDTQEINKRWGIGTAYLVGSTLVRGVMTATFWIRKPDVPVLVTQSVPEALKWIGDKATAKGLVVPDGILR